MSQTPRRGGSWLLWCSFLFFLVFALLACYHKYHDALLAYFTAHSDATLMEELASATLLDEPEPLGGGWPQWRGVHRDGVAYEKDLDFTWPEDGPPKLWTIKIGKGYSSFAVFGNRAYTQTREGDQEGVVCLDLNGEGAELWKYQYSCDFQNGFGDGPRSTPALDRESQHALSAAAGPYARATSVLHGDRLYTVGAAGHFNCLDAVTGKPLWEKELLGEFSAQNLPWGTTFSPLIEGELVITTPGGPDAAIVAFDKHSGAVRWKTQSDKAGYSSPLAVDAAGRRQILMFGGKALVSVAAEDGHLLWRYTWEVNSDVNAATPTVFHARSKDGQMLAYVFITSGYDKGSALLKMGTDGQGQPNVSVVYSGMVNADRHNQMGSQFSSPVRHGDNLYGFTETKLRCLNLKTGIRQWDKDGFYKGSLLRVGEHLLVLGEKGQLAVLPASPDGQPDILASATPFDARRPKCWTMPVLADGRLLLREEQENRDENGEIVCIDLRKHPAAK